ncbi:MAG: helix-turn-helix domain-containing protein [Acutalibacteraceae bacterium]
MQLYQILDNLMTTLDLTAYKISKETGISDRLIGYWRKGDKLPGAENLITLANYFGISVDYLLGRTDEPSINTGDSISEVSKSSSDDCNSGADEQEQHLLSNYKKLNEQAQHALVDYSDFVSSKPENLKDTADTDQMIS